MCGILGQIERSNEVNETQFHSMLSTLAHRGPDGEGMWFSSDKKIAFGHRRLSFFDLSELGKQPMVSTEKEVVITFNGEIYNFESLREELSLDYPFQSNTDTEVLLAAYEKWGMGFLSKIEGMFAMALFDQQKQQVILVRDRFGIKPLYFTLQEERFLFSSELKAIVACSQVPKKINPSAMMDFFVYRYIPSPKTIWLNVEKVEPAQYVVIDLKTFTKTKTHYWKLTESKEKVGKEVFSSDFRKEFQQSVQEHLRADVPVGSFLSGGYDSSAIVLAAAQTDKRNDLKTFTVGFESWDQSEDQFAEQLCEQLEVSNKKVRLSDESLGLLERMPDVYDEPIADISIVPTYAVSQLARTDRKAVLSGEGADELFLGYHWQKEWVELNRFHIKNIFRAKPNLKSFYAQSMSMGEFNREELTSMFTDSYRGAVEEDIHWFYQKHMRSDLSPIKAIQHLDVKCFMGELVLTKIDRASMANSLEVRVPFLKHSFFETLFKHDPSDYFQKGLAKFPIHSFLKNQIPENLLRRKKQGFVGPDAYYMNHDFYRKELLHSTLIEDGIIRREYIEKQLEIPYNWRLWKIVVFEKWYARWRKEISN